MTILENIEKTFNENKIRYFKGVDETKQILNVPYRGIDNETNHINIYIDIDEELEIITFTFLESANKNIDIETIRDKLLNLNSQLVSGALSMRSNSNTIEYKLSYQLKDKNFSFEQYNIYIVKCVQVYEMMQKEDII